MSAEETKIHFRCADRAFAEASLLFWWLRHPFSSERPERPLATLKATLAVLRLLPRLTVQLTDNPPGQRIRMYLSETRFGLPVRLYVKSFIPVPAPGEPLFSGRAMQAARTNVRRATKDGLTCHEVPQSGAAPGLRVFRMVDADGQRVGEASITCDAAWALLHEVSSDTSNGFYLLHSKVMAELQEAEVRFLLVNARNPLLLRPGLLYMQGRLGYEVVNLRLDRRAQPSLRPRFAPAGVHATRELH